MGLRRLLLSSLGYILISEMGWALRPQSCAASTTCQEALQQSFEEAEAELDRLGIRRIAGASDAPESPDYQPLDIAWIERKSRFIFIRGYLNELRVLRMTGSRQLIMQTIHDIISLVLEEKDAELIWQSEQLLLLPLREFLDDPESTTLYRQVFIGYRKLWSEARRQHREAP